MYLQINNKNAELLKNKSTLFVKNVNQKITNQNYFISFFTQCLNYKWIIMQFHFINILIFVYILTSL